MIPGHPVSADATTLALLLVPGFDLLSLGAVTEPLREANLLAGNELYRWTLHSPDGKPVTDTNRAALGVASGFDDFRSADIMLVFGPAADHPVSKQLGGDLRAAWRRGARIGAVGTAVQLLANAGILAEREFTLHWQSRASFFESHWHLCPSDHRFCIDQRILTCGGGISASDLILQVIERDHGFNFAQEIADLCLHNGPRNSGVAQKMPLNQRFATRNKTLLSVLNDIRANLSSDISIETLCLRHSISRRQLERLFSSELGMTPARFVKDARLCRGRLLLMQTDLTVGEVAACVGFYSASNFRNSFRQKYGISPFQFALRAESDPAA